MTDSERILVGVVGAPHGVRGEVRLKSYTGDPGDILDFKSLALDTGGRLEFVSGRLLKDDMLVVRFAGVADRDAAQALTNKRLYVDRARLPPAEEEEYYHIDLVGLGIEDEAGDPLGTVTAVQNFGAGDLLEIAPSAGGDTVLVPFTKAFVPTVDLPRRRAVVTEAAWAVGRPELPEPGEDRG